MSKREYMSCCSRSSRRAVGNGEVLKVFLICPVHATSTEMPSSWLLWLRDSDTLLT